MNTYKHVRFRATSNRAVQVSARAGSSRSVLQFIPILRLHSQTISESVSPRQVTRSLLTREVLEETGSPFQPRGAAFSAQAAAGQKPQPRPVHLRTPSAQDPAQRAPSCSPSEPACQKPPAGNGGPGGGAPSPNDSCSRKRGPAWGLPGQWRGRREQHS